MRDVFFIRLTSQSSVAFDGEKRYAVNPAIARATIPQNMGLIGVRLDCGFRLDSLDGAIMVCRFSGVKNYDCASVVWSSDEESADASSCAPA